jgi:hypothetical protein
MVRNGDAVCKGRGLAWMTNHEETKFRVRENIKPPIYGPLYHYFDPESKTAFGSIL